MNIFTYTKNVAKSVVYAASDEIKDLAPVTKDFMDVNNETISSIYGAMKDLRTTRKRMTAYIKKSNLYEAASEGLKAISEDIRTGNFYNKERTRRFEDRALGDMGMDDGFDMSGFDFDTNDDFNFDDDGTSSGSKSKEDKLSEDVVMSSKDNAEAISSTVVKVGKYASEVSKANTMILLDQQVKANNIMEKGFTSIFDRIGQLGNQTAEIGKIQADNSKKFYETATNLMQTQVNLLGQIVELQKKSLNITDDNKKENKNKKLTYSDIVTAEGNVDLKAYASNVKSNVLNSIPTTIRSLLEGGMVGTGNTMLALVGSPLSFIPKTIVKTIIPKVLKKSIQDFGITLSGAFSGVMADLNKMKNSENGIESLLANIFGVKTKSINKPNTASYAKGAMPFNGMTQKAIIEVIPGYLRKIESLLSGTGERIYDWDKGRWTSGENLKREFDDVEKSAYRRAYSDVYREMTKLLTSSAAYSKQELETLSDQLQNFLETVVKKDYGNPRFNQDSKEKYYEYSGKSKTPLTEETMKLFINAFNATNRSSRSQLSKNALEARDSIAATYNRMYENPAVLELLNNSGIDLGYKLDNKGTKYQKIKSKPGNVANMALDKVTDDLGHNVFYYLQNMYSEMIEFRKQAYGMSYYNGPTREDIENFNFRMYGNIPPVPPSGNNTTINTNIGQRIGPNLTANINRQRTRRSSNNTVNINSSRRIANNRSNPYGLLVTRNYIPNDNAVKKNENKQKEKDREDNENFYANTDDNGLINGLMGYRTGRMTEEEIDAIIKKMEKESEKAYSRKDYESYKRSQEMLDYYAENNTFINNALDEKRAKNLKMYNEVTDRAMSKKRNKDKELSVVDKLLAAQTLGERMSIVTTSLDKVLEAPSKFLTNIMLKADERLYNLVFGNEKGEVHQLNGKPVNSIMGEIVFQIKNTFNKVNNWFKESILTPVKKAGIKNPGDLIKWVGEQLGISFDKTKENIKNKWNNFKSGFKTQFEGLKTVMKEFFTDNSNPMQETPTGEQGEKTESKPTRADRYTNMVDAIKSINKLIVAYNEEQGLDADNIDQGQIAYNEDTGEYNFNNISNKDKQKAINVLNTLFRKQTSGVTSLKDNTGKIRNEVSNNDIITYLRSAPNAIRNMEYVYRDANGNMRKRKLADVTNKNEILNLKNEDYARFEKEFIKFLDNRADTDRRLLEENVRNRGIDVESLKELQKDPRKLNKLFEQMMMYNRFGGRDFVNLVSRPNLLNELRNSRQNVRNTSSRIRELDNMDLEDYTEQDYESAINANAEARRLYNNQLNSINTFRTERRNRKKELNSIYDILIKNYDFNKKGLDTNYMLKNMTAEEIKDALLQRNSDLPANKQITEETLNKIFKQKADGTYDINKTLLNKCVSNINKTLGEERKANIYDINQKLSEAMANFEYYNNDEIQRRLFKRADGEQDISLTRDNIESLRDAVKEDLDIYSGVARGSRYVTRTGLTTIHEGELVIPSELNPFNPNRGKVSKSQEIRDENNVKNKFLRNLSRNISSNAEGNDGAGNPISGTNTATQIQNAINNINTTSDALYRKFKDGDLYCYALRSDPNSNIWTVISLSEKDMKRAGENNTPLSTDLNVHDIPRNDLIEKKAYLATMANDGSNLQRYFTGEDGIEKVDNIIRNALYDSGVTEKSYEKGKKAIAKYAPAVAAGGLVGAAGGLGSSLLFGLPGGPIIGAAIGIIGNLAKNSKTISDAIFGKLVVDSEGNESRIGGFISDETQKAFKKYAPSMVKTGLLGTVAGLITPLGPLGGALIGSAVGFLRKNEEFEGIFFGEDGIWSLEDKEKFKKALPRAGIGAAAGALTGLLGGPFGILGGAVVGAAGGIASTSDRFKDIVLGRSVDTGKKDKDGNPIMKREGGLFGALKKITIEPVKDVADWMKKNFKTFVKKDIMDPLKSFVKPVGNMIKNAMTSIAKSFTNVLDRFTMSKLGVPFADALNDKLINPITNTLKKILRAPIKAALLPATLPFKALGALGNRIRGKQIMKGTDLGSTAEERLEFRNNHKLSTTRLLPFLHPKNANGYLTLDQNLASSSSQGIEQALQTMYQLKAADSTNADRALQEKDKEIQNLIMNNFDAKPGHAGRIFAALKADQKNSTIIGGDAFKLISNLKTRNGDKLTPEQAKEVILNLNGLMAERTSIENAKKLSREEINKKKSELTKQGFITTLTGKIDYDKNIRLLEDEKKGRQKQGLWDTTVLEENVKDPMMELADVLRNTTDILKNINDAITKKNYDAVGNDASIYYTKNTRDRIERIRNSNILTDEEKDKQIAEIRRLAENTNKRDHIAAINKEFDNRANAINISNMSPLDRTLQLKNLEDEKQARLNEVDNEVLNAVEQRSFIRRANSNRNALNKAIERYNLTEEDIATVGNKRNIRRTKSANKAIERINIRSDKNSKVLKTYFNSEEIREINYGKYVNTNDKKSMKLVETIGKFYSSNSNSITYAGNVTTALSFEGVKILLRSKSTEKVEWITNTLLPIYSSVSIPLDDYIINYILNNLNRETLGILKSFISKIGSMSGPHFRSKKEILLNFINNRKNIDRLCEMTETQLNNSFIYYAKEENYDKVNLSELFSSNSNQYYEDLRIRTGNNNRTLNQEYIDNGVAGSSLEATTEDISNRAYGGYIDNDETAVVSRDELIIDPYDINNYAEGNGLFNKIRNKFNERSKRKNVMISDYEEFAKSMNLIDENTNEDKARKISNVAGNFENFFIKNSLSRKSRRELASKIKDYKNYDKILNTDRSQLTEEELEEKVNATKQQTELLKDIKSYLSFDTTDDGDTVKKLIDKHGDVYINKLDPKNKRGLKEGEVNNNNSKFLQTISEKMENIHSAIFEPDAETGKSVAQGVGDLAKKLLKIAGIGVGASTIIDLLFGTGASRALLTNTVDIVKSFYNDKMKPIVGEFFTETVPNFFTKTLPQFLGTAFGNAMSFLGSAAGWLGEHLGQMGETVWTVVSGFASGVNEFIKKSTNGTVDLSTAGNSLGTIELLGKNVIRKVVTGSEKSLLNGVRVKIPTIAGKIGSNIFNTTASVAEGSTSSLSSGVRWIRGKANSLSSSIAVAKNEATVAKNAYNRYIETVGGNLIGTGVRNNAKEYANNVVKELRESTNNAISTALENTVGKEAAEQAIKTSTTTGSKQILKGLTKTEFKNTMKNMMVNTSDTNVVLNAISQESKSTVGRAISKMFYNISTKIRSFLMKFVNAQTAAEVAEKLGKSNIGKKIFGNVLNASADAAASIASSAASLVCPVIQIIFSAADLLTPIFSEPDAQSILGVNQPLDFGQRFIAGIINLLMGLPGSKTLFTIIKSILGPQFVSWLFFDVIFKDLDLAGITSLREQSVQVVNDFNKANGTNFTVDTFNQVINGNKTVWTNVNEALGGGIDALFHTTDADLIAQASNDAAENGNTSFNIDEARKTWANATVNENGKTVLKDGNTYNYEIDDSTNIEDNSSTNVNNKNATNALTEINNTLKNIFSFLTGGTTEETSTNNDDAIVQAYMQSTGLDEATIRASLYGSGSGRYSQRDKSINMRYNKPGDTIYQDLNTSGCGPIAATNLINRHIKTGMGLINPEDAAKYALNHGYKETNGGTDPRYFKDYFSKNGIESTITSDKKQMRDAIKSGRQVVLMGKDPSYGMGNNPYGPNPHYVVATGMRGNSIIVDNPEEYNEYTAYDANDTINKSTKAIITGPKYGMGTENNIIEELPSVENLHGTEIDDLSEFVKRDGEKGVIYKLNNLFIDIADNTGYNIGDNTGYNNRLKNNDKSFDNIYTMLKMNKIFSNYKSNKNLFENYGIKLDDNSIKNLYSFLNHIFNENDNSINSIKNNEDLNIFNRFSKKDQDTITETYQNLNDYLSNIDNSAINKTDKNYSLYNLLYLAANLIKDNKGNPIFNANTSNNSDNKFNQLQSYILSLSDMYIDMIKNNKIFNKYNEIYSKEKEKLENIKYFNKTVYPYIYDKIVTSTLPYSAYEKENNTINILKFLTAANAEPYSGNYYSDNNNNFLEWIYRINNMLMNNVSDSITPLNGSYISNISRFLGDEEGNSNTFAELNSDKLLLDKDKDYSNIGFGITPSEELKDLLRSITSSKKLPDFITPNMMETLYKIAEDKVEEKYPTFYKYAIKRDTLTNNILTLLKNGGINSSNIDNLSTENMNDSTIDDDDAINKIYPTFGKDEYTEAIRYISKYFKGVKYSNSINEKFYKNLNIDDNYDNTSLHNAQEYWSKDIQNVEDFKIKNTNSDSYKLLNKAFSNAMYNYNKDGTEDSYNDARYKDTYLFSPYALSHIFTNNDVEFLKYFNIKLRSTRFKNGGTPFEGKTVGELLDNSEVRESDAMTPYKNFADLVTLLRVIYKNDDLSKNILDTELISNYVDKSNPYVNYRTGTLNPNPAFLTLLDLDDLLGIKYNSTSLSNPRLSTGTMYKYGYSNFEDKYSGTPIALDSKFDINSSNAKTFEGINGLSPSQIISDLIDNMDNNSGIGSLKLDTVNEDDLIDINSITDDDTISRVYYNKFNNLDKDQKIKLMYHVMSEYHNKNTIDKSDAGDILKYGFSTGYLDPELFYNIYLNNTDDKSKYFADWYMNRANVNADSNFNNIYKNNATDKNIISEDKLNNMSSEDERYYRIINNKLTYHKSLDTIDSIKDINSYNASEVDTAYNNFVDLIYKDINNLKNSGSYTNLNKYVKTDSYYGTKTPYSRIMDLDIDLDAIEGLETPSTQAVEGANGLDSHNNPIETYNSGITEFDPIAFEDFAVYSELSPKEITEFINYMYRAQNTPDNYRIFKSCTQDFIDLSKEFNFNPRFVLGIMAAEFGLGNNAKTNEGSRYHIERYNYLSVMKPGETGHKGMVDFSEKDTIISGIKLSKCNSVKAALRNAYIYLRKISYENRGQKTLFALNYTKGCAFCAGSQGWMDLVIGIIKNNFTENTKAKYIKPTQEQLNYFHKVEGSVYDSKTLPKNSVVKNIVSAVKNLFEGIWGSDLVNFFTGNDITDNSEKTVGTTGLTYSDYANSTRYSSATDFFVDNLVTNKGLSGVSGKTSDFGPRNLGNGAHFGIDIGEGYNGAPTIVSPVNGTLVHINPDNGTDGYGNWVMVKDNYAGYNHIFAHMDKINDNLTEGQEIVRGSTPLGIMGSTGISTGPHLHYGVEKVGSGGLYSTHTFFDEKYHKSGTNAEGLEYNSLRGKSGITFADYGWMDPEDYIAEYDQNMIKERSNDTTDNSDSTDTSSETTMPTTNAEAAEANVDAKKYGLGSGLYDRGIKKTDKKYKSKLAMPRLTDRALADMASNNKTITLAKHIETPPIPKDKINFGIGTSSPMANFNIGTGKEYSLTDKLIKEQEDKLNEYVEKEISKKEEEKKSSAPQKPVKSPPKTATNKGGIGGGIDTFNTSNNDQIVLLTTISETLKAIDEKTAQNNAFLAAFLKAVQNGEIKTNSETFTNMITALQGTSNTNAKINDNTSETLVNTMIGLVRQ